jgi:tetratricopeptide (TPR) repeat protein
MQIAREEYANALENIEKCISLYNNEGRDLYLDLLLKRGCLLVMLGRYDEALKSLNLALAEDPSAADVYLVKAQIYAERQNMEALTECLTAYIRLRPEDNSIRALLAQAQFTEGNYEAAARQYEELMQNDPNAEIEYLYGLNAVRNSDFAAAEAALSSAISKGFRLIGSPETVSIFLFGDPAVTLIDFSNRLGRSKRPPTKTWRLKTLVPVA